MSKVFSRYVVAGDPQDMKAFEAIIRHINRCIITGSNRDIVITVDGDGSADLRFYRSEVQKELSDEEMDNCKQVEYLDYPKDDRDKLLNEKEDVELGVIGVMKANGDGHYYIGE